MAKVETVGAVVVEYLPGASGCWYVRIKGRNGEVTLVSESYASKGNAKRGAERIGSLIPASIVRQGTL